MSSLEEKTRKAMENKEKSILEDVLPKQKRNRRTPIRRTPKSTKIIVPEHIKVLFDNLDKSISSVWGVQANGKVKWDAKYSMWVVFKEYFKELSK